MSSAKLTLYSFAQWMDAQGTDLFSLVQLPEGIDKDTLTDNILMRGGEFEVVYSDPNFMQYCIGTWSKKWYRTFEKWITALNIEYNPLENYDRMEDYTDTSNKGVKTHSERGGENTQTNNNEDKRTANLTDENTVSAYDSSSYQPSNKSTESGTDTMNHTGTIKNEYGEDIDGSETENGKTIHSGRIHGNVGVTTSQQMLESELSLAKWNIYEHITDIFLEEFVIPIYS